MAAPPSPSVSSLRVTIPLAGPGSLLGRLRQPAARRTDRRRGNATPGDGRGDKDTDTAALRQQAFSVWPPAIAALPRGVFPGGCLIKVLRFR